MCLLIITHIWVHNGKGQAGQKETQNIPSEVKEVLGNLMFKARLGLREIRRPDEQKGAFRAGPLSNL